MFFDIRAREGIAVITPERQVTYQELQERVSRYDFQSSRKELILLLCDHEAEHVAAYLAALQAKHAVMLVSSSLSIELLDQIIRTYQPKWIVAPNTASQFDGYDQQGNVWERKQAIDLGSGIYPELAVLLSTSGTTGSQKFVRLSYANLQSNAEAIAQYLEIDEHERGILNLPLSYSYGLSILNSHFHMGAAVLLTSESVMSKSFWNFVQEQRATSLPGVPFTYQMLQRIGFTRMNLPDLRTLTQAGGRLDERLVRLFGEYAREHGKRFFVMYGQTEASPRISYVPHDQVLRKPGSIGIAIPGGELSLDAETNELIYRGSNVMLGYAETFADLAKGDECHGVLYTGDVANVDEDGYFSITGRMKRFIKLFGLRINLDEVERRLESLLSQPVACAGNDDKLLIALEDGQRMTEVKEYISELYQLHHGAYKVIIVNEIPRLANGKIDYQALKDE